VVLDDPNGLATGRGFDFAAVITGRFGLSGSVLGWSGSVLNSASHGFGYSAIPKSRCFQIIAFRQSNCDGSLQTVLFPSSMLSSGSVLFPSSFVDSCQMVPTGVSIGSTKQRPSAVTTDFISVALKIEPMLFTLLNYEASPRNQAS
jgi:hypothetical protein